MFGMLPQALVVAGKEMKINSDFRVAIRIFNACNDVNADDIMKTRFMIETLYQHPEDITDMGEAVKKALWYLNLGSDQEEAKPATRMYDWNQDEQIIFSSVNKVAGRETRESDYIHFWTFMGYFQEIGEGILSYVIGIRDKKSKNKKLTKEEMSFYMKNKDLIDIKKQYTEREKAEMDAVAELIGV